MKGLMLFIGLSVAATTIYADDPGIPDTVIVGTVYAEIGDPYVDVPIFVVTDDSVVFYIMPITWSPFSDEISASDVFYYNIMVYWDTFDSVLIDQQFMRMIGGGDRNHCLLTYGYRMQCWDIRFAIDSLASPQIVTVDTAYDPINGVIMFGLIGGIEELQPVFVPGAIYYGIPADIRNDGEIIPSDVTVLRNYPNPFNATTTIEFTLSEEKEVRLSVYNILGQKTAVLFEGQKEAGEHKVTWDAGDLPSGVYFARLEAQSYSKNVKMVLLK